MIIPQKKPLDSRRSFTGLVTRAPPGQFRQHDQLREGICKVAVVLGKGVFHLDAKHVITLGIRKAAGVFQAEPEVCAENIGLIACEVALF